MFIVFISAIDISKYASCNSFVISPLFAFPMVFHLLFYWCNFCGCSCKRLHRNIYLSLVTLLLSIGILIFGIFKWYLGYRISRRSLFLWGSFFREAPFFFTFNFIFLSGIPFGLKGPFFLKAGAFNFPGIFGANFGALGF